MPASPPASESALLAFIIGLCWAMAGGAILVWCGVFVARVRRLHRDRRNAIAEHRLIGLVLDHTARAAEEREAAVFAALKSWEREVLLRVVRQLIEQTKGRDRLLLVGALHDAGFHRQALTDLRHGSSLRRLHAANLLGDFEDEESITALRHALADQDDAVRLAAARALLRLDRIDRLSDLLKALAFSHQDPPLTLAELLAQLPERLIPEAVQLLGAPLPTEWLRMLAIALGRRQVSTAYDAFSLLRRSDSPRVRAATWVALAELGDPRAGDLVADGLRDPSPDVRRAAAQCAGQLGEEAVLAPLAVLLKDADWNVAWAAAQALLQSGPAGRERLEMHGRSAPEGDAGKQALLELAPAPAP